MIRLPVLLLLGLAPAIVAAQTGARELVVEFPSEGFRLQGTLTLPPSPGAPPPAVVLVHESGPVDRDESWGKGNATFRELATGLAARGVASFRYDPRGVGQSSGDFLDAGLYDFGLDAARAIDALATRTDVDPRRLFVLGHGYGGKAALIAAHQRGIAGVVQLAGLLEKEPDHQLRVVKFQHEVDGLDPKESEKILSTHRKFMRDLANGRYILPDDYFRDLGLAEWMQQAQILNPQPPRWWRDNLLFDPVAALSDLACPVLVLAGENDWLVDAVELKATVEAVSAGGKSNVTLQIFPGLNHRFIWMTSPRKAYQFEKDLLQSPSDTTFAIDPGVVASIGNWVLTVTPILAGTVPTTPTTAAGGEQK